MNIRILASGMIVAGQWCQAMVCCVVCGGCRMGWFVLSGVILALGYLFYARASKGYLSARQVRQIQDLLERETLRIKAYRQEAIQRNGERGKTIPLEQVVIPLEKSKARYRDDLKYVASVERTIEELKRRYQRHIPVDEI